MKINEIVKSITGEEETELASNIIGALKKRDGEHPDMVKIEKQWRPKMHEIYNKAIRPDKTVVREVNGEEMSTIEPVARIALAIQKLIVKRAASFLFGNEVVVLSGKMQLSKQEELALESLKKILSSNKEKSHNKELARELFKCTEVAEVWQAIESETIDRYGFKSPIKLKSHILSPGRGDKLYPLFDDYGDMIAFSREWRRKENGKDVTYFETYTSDEWAVWKQDGSSWNEEKRVENTIGKIPVIYARQDESEWSDVQNIIERLEKLLSNYADTIDYHASPTIFIQGKVTGFAKKGEAGKIIEGDNGAKAEYLSWDQAPDAVKLEIENDLRMIFSLTQTPDISFESVKGLSKISGIALKLLFLDAHLKVEDKKEIFDPFLTRRYNILKAYIGVMNLGLKTAADGLDLSPDIVPYMIGDDQALIEMLSTATGQKQIVSQETAVSILGFAKDIKSEIKQIANESVGGMEQ